MEELNLGPPNRNPSSGREEDLNSGPLDRKSSALNHKATLPQQMAFNMHFLAECLLINNMIGSPVLYIHLENSQRKFHMRTDWFKIVFL